MSRKCEVEPDDGKYVDRRGKPISELEYTLLRSATGYRMVAEKSFGHWWDVAATWHGFGEKPFTVTAGAGLRTVALVEVRTEAEALYVYGRMIMIVEAAMGPDGFRNRGPDLVDDVHNVLDEIRKVESWLDDDPETPAPEDTKPEPAEKVSESEPVNLNKETVSLEVETPPKPEELPRTPASPKIAVIPAFGPTPTKKRKPWWKR